VRTITLDENVDVEMRLIKFMNAFEELQIEHEALKQKHDELLEIKAAHDAAYLESLNRE